MNILHINARDKVGGAALAAYRLHQGLKGEGHVSRILVGSRVTTDPDVFTIDRTVDGNYSSLDSLIDSLSRRLEKRLGLQQTRYQSTKHILASDLFQHAHIIHFHGLQGRYFNYHQLPAFSRHKPIVWTLHDMWALTGHCSYAYDCRRWKTGCGNCPLLQEPGRQIVEPPPTRRDHTRQIWYAKQKLYQQTELHIVTPSRWLCSLAHESILAESASIQCIPYGLDLTVFQPIDQALARRALDIPLDAKTILFISESITKGRKGMRYLLGALDRLQDTKSIVLLTVGEGGAGGSQLDRFKRRDLGPLSDERLICLAYNAADVFVFPTLADNLPLVLLESMACGTPIVSFDVGGVPEIVRHMETGYLARYKDVEDLAKGIQMILENEDLRHKLEYLCRKIAEAEYSLQLQARRYVELYQYVVERYLLNSI